mmetsp:Transcript_21365/g.41462  ORF Transcript_21365/g.41462 Transcript_21365/m.41462 type:complete len:1040 (+) Transcript_21365:395-3514(+)
MFGIFIFCFIVSISGLAGGAFTLVEPTIYDWVVSDGRAALESEAVKDAENRASQGFTLVREQDSDIGRFWMTFDWDGGDIFTAPNVKTMCEVEQVFLNAKDYGRFCRLNATTGRCLEPTLTVTYAFYGTVADSSCPLLPEAQVSNRARELYDGLTISNETRAYSAFFMEKSTEERTPVFTSRTRSRIDLGAPLEGFTSIYDEEADQQKDYTEFYEDVSKDYFDAFNMESVWLHSAYRDRQQRNGITCKWYSRPLGDIESTELATGDLLLCIFSLAFVYLWMLYQMRSFFLASFCMLQIIISLPVSIVVYRSVFQVSYFQFIHILVIFLILGIGADDVFVMNDGWRFSADAVEVKELEKAGADRDTILETRLEVAFTSTIGAIFTTSFTTIVSFLATSISPIMPISTFGLLAATAILLNFLLVITLIPAVILTNHYWFVEKQCCIYSYIRVSDDEDKDDDNDQPKYLEEGKVDEEKSDEGTSEDFQKEPMKDKAYVAAAKNGKMKETKDRPDEKDEMKLRNSVSSIEGKIPHRLGSTGGSNLGSLQAMISVGEEKGHAEEGEDAASPAETAVSGLDWFIARAYQPAMTVKRGKYYPVAIAAVAFFLTYAIISLAFSTQLTPPDDSAQFLPKDHMLVKVPDELQEEYIPGEFSNFAEVQYPFGLDGFDRGDFDRYKPGENRGKVKFLSDFDFFPEESQRLFTFACQAAQDRTCGYDACNFGRFMLPRPNAIKCFLPSFQKWFISRNPGLTTFNCSRSQFYSELQLYRNDTSTVSEDGLTTSDKLALIGFVDNELKYVRIDFYTTIRTDEATIDVADARNEADDLADMINNHKNTIGATAMGDTYSASQTWVGVEVEFGILEGFYSGLAICFPVAFVVLIFATGNLLIAVYAIITIVFIVVSVLATIVWDGGTLGIAEAIAGVIVIGFSVDYCLHLGHSFVDAYHGFGIKSRGERFNHAAIGMGATVIAGAITTFGASLPLLGAQFQFFPTMGGLMAATVAFSITFSLLCVSDHQRISFCKHFVTLFCVPFHFCPPGAAMHN